MVDNGQYISHAVLEKPNMKCLDNHCECFYTCCCLLLVSFDSVSSICNRDITTKFSAIESGKDHKLEDVNDRSLNE